MAFCLTGCSDFFNQESDHVIYSDNHEIDQATDTIYSMTGILSKLQSIADRTILLGEVRGDLVTLTNTANSDLRDVATFNIGDANMYNSPRDYYAVINNCNYYIAHCDTALRDNRNSQVFMREYAQAKAIRAWTYLQLAINYGKVPFYTDPILTKEQSDAVYPQYDIQAICEYFINDLLPLADRWANEYPGYRYIRNTDSRFFFFPINVVLGDLYLWAASVTQNVEQYKQAALRYYRYISQRNGNNSAYPTSNTRVTWAVGSTSWNYPSGSTDYEYSFEQMETYGINSELITMIPCDSTRAEGNYSELRNLFNSTNDNNYYVSITPSARILEISAAQDFCCLGTNGTTVTYAPKDLSENRNGDLRLSALWYQYYSRNNSDDRVQMQYIYKYQTRNVHIYRRQLIYLRMAEALNLAGYPRMAFQVLSRGLTNKVIQEEVYPYYSESDSLWISQFDFPTSRYTEMTADMLTGVDRTRFDTQGIHSRGSGFTPYNEYYQLPVDTLKTEAEQTALFQEYVNNLILTEEALEFSFEGMRYYDLLRFALRSSDPSFLANHIYMRRGEKNTDTVKGEIKADLNDRKNWFLNWNGKIGY